MHFLLPADPLDPRKPDEAFLDQIEALRRRGFTTSLVDLEKLGTAGTPFRNPPPPGSRVVYRGWMMKPEVYGLLVRAITVAGAEAFVSTDAYAACHHLPNWYPLISELTPETKILSLGDDLTAELKKLGWGKFFIKDYVKSLKTSVGSVISDPEAISTVVAEMLRFRGEIEGGICVRRFEALQHGTETRHFVIDGDAHAPSGESPDIVRECARRIRSPFFSIDVAVRDDGVLRVVEIGDGQVSDLVGWTADRFAELWPRDSI
jgi:hypothetical protein